MKKSKSSRKNKIKKNGTYKKKLRRRNKVKKKRVSKVKRQSGGGSFNPQALNGIKNFLDGMKPTKATFVVEKGSQDCNGLSEIVVNDKRMCYYSNVSNTNSGNPSAQQNSIPFTQQMVGANVEEITGTQDGMMMDSNGMVDATATVIPNGMPEANATVPGNGNEISVVENTGKTNNNKVINASSTISEVPPVIDVTQPQVAEVTLNNGNTISKTAKKSRIPSVSDLKRLGSTTKGSISQKFGKQFRSARNGLKTLGKDRNSITEKLNKSLQSTRDKMKKGFTRKSKSLTPPSP